MRVIALEEHTAFPDLIDRIPRDVVLARGWATGDALPKAVKEPQDHLPEVGNDRRADMRANAIDIQILSVVGPGADLLPGADGVAFAQEANDRLANIVSDQPDLYRAFAHLPLLDPQAAAEELQRAVNRHGLLGALISGTTEGRFLDDQRFESLLGCAESLDVPIYIHPGIPPGPVREAYYQGLPPAAGTQLAQAGYGWHTEIAIHILRLVLSGTFARHPRLKVIIGHMGETLPYMLARVDREFSEDAPHLLEPPSQTIRRQVWATTSGMFEHKPLELLINAFGTDRVLFGIDYPFEPLQRGREFLDALSSSLEPAVMHKILHSNAETLLSIDPAG